MEVGKGHTFVDPGVELEEGEELADEDVDVDMEDALTDAVPPNVLDDETRELAAGLASLDEGELLAALEGMQKAVIRPDGGKVLIAFVLASPHCTELMGAWERGPAAATAVPVMLLLYYIFRHTLGKAGGTAASGGHTADFLSTEKESHRKAVAVKLRLDKVARLIVRNRMKDIYSHLSSSQKSRQNCALLLLSAIVLRGRALAIEIATSFDFTLEALRKLGYPPKQSAAHKTVKIEGGHRGILKQPTRVAFLELAISFLTVGDPGLLRWVLQKRPLWIGVLHGISKDDEKTGVRVLRLLKEKVMAPAFMVPRGLQSVLFGDATLEQLARISSDNSLVEAKELAHAILLSLCTDASHGLCPEESELSKAVPGRGQSGAFGGGQGRLLRLMLRLKVTEVDQHREVLLATARARPKLAILYLASFPLSLEPRLSPAWFNAMSLVAQVIPIASQPTSFSSLASQSLISQPNGDLIHSMFQSLIPSSLSRVVLNRGLLHVDFMVKHACLRVLLEALLCLKNLIKFIHDARSLELEQRPSEENSFLETLRETGVKNLVTALKPAVQEDSLKHESLKLIQSIQDIMRASLPDPNTLLAILSSLKLPQGLKTMTNRTPSQPHTPPVTKKRKRKELQNLSDNQEVKSFSSDTYDYDATIRMLWGGEVSDEVSKGEGIEGCLHAKVVQVLAAYQMALPAAMADIGFDAFKLLPDDPTSLSVDQQKSLSALLLAATGSCTFLPSEDPGWFVGGSAGFGSAYKNFKQLLMFMLMSTVNEVRDAVYEVIHRVMASTGAFENNAMEINLWLDSLVLWKIEKSESIYASVVDFLSHAVSSFAQNSYKYLDSLHSILNKFLLREDTKHSVLQSGSLEDYNSSEVGPFVICALEKFIQLICKSKVPGDGRSTVALYLVNVLHLLLQYQLNPQSLAMVVITLISRERESIPPEQADSPECTVLLALLESAQSLLSNDGENNLRRLSTSSTGTLVQRYEAGKLAEVLKACSKDHDTTSDEKISALISSMVCVSVEELVDNFPLLVRVCLEDLEGDFSLPIALLGIHEGVLTKVSTVWPEFFTGALELLSSVKYSSEDMLTVDKAKEMTVMLKSSSVEIESYAICLLLLVSPFPVLFSAATYGGQSVLLTLPRFTSLLQAGLLRVHYRNWVCMGRLIISGMKHLAALPVEEIGDGAPLQTCFSLIRTVMLPTTEQPMGGSFSSNKLIETVREHVIIDVLKHPVFYNLFMHGDRKLIPSMAPCSYFSDLRRDTKDNTICDSSLRRILASAATCVHPIDCHILSLLKQVLDFSETVVKSVTNFSESQGVVSFTKEVLSAYRPYVLKAIVAFQKEVDESLTFGVVASPALFAVSVLIPYTDPSLLLSIFLSLLSKKALKVKSSKQAVSPHVLGMHFVTVFVDSLSGAASHLRNEGDGKDEVPSGAPSMYDLFEKVVYHVTGSPSIMADLCLLSFLRAPKLSQLPLPFLEQHFLHFKKISTALACSIPLEVLRHCVCHPNRVTRKISFLLVQTNLVHLTEFGRLVAAGTSERGTSILKLSTSLGLAEMLLTRTVGNQKMEFLLSDEDLLCLLPAAQVYIASKSRKIDAKGQEVAKHIASIYVKLLTRQLKKWEKFVSESNAMDEVQDSKFTISPLLSRSDLYDSLLQFYNCSQLGQVVHMLQSCHALHSLSMKVKTKLMESLLPEENVALVTQSLGLSAGEDISPCVCEAVARVDIIRHLLSSGSSSQTTENVSALETQEQPQTRDFASLEKMSLWQKFLRSLMSTLEVLYKSMPLDGNRAIDTDKSETQSETGRNHWVQFLEEYLLLQVTEVAKELAGFPLATSEYLPLYKYSMKTLLRYRYGETSAMQACRHLTFVVFQGLQSQMVPKGIPADGDVLELLIAHSKFLPSLIIVDSKRMYIPHISGKHAAKGTAFNSLSSVLSLIGSPLLHISAKELGHLANGDSVAEPVSALKETISADVTDISKSSREKLKHIRAKSAADGVNRLEIVKLLRILLGVRLKQFTLGTLDAPSLPLDEVLSILLAAYGATLSLVDQEIFLLMQEIESHGGLGFSGLAGLDYLWGEAALKRRRAKAEEATLNALKEEPDSTDELRRQTFKEDLLIDPRRCGLAVLFFPLKRNFGTADIGQLGLASQYKESREGTSERSSVADDDVKDAAYDPAFLLLFALHGLSIGCINAEEFVQLGLLAIAFASMSSEEQSMRKAGYELLAKYYSFLEDGPSFKGRLQIRLLMTYVKNAVTEPWQRIPVVFAVFAAEASCILMHPESHQYATINRFLLRAPGLDLESIPLFQVMFGSGSVHYRSERLWMLRLLADGLRTSLDASVYRRKFVLELLMSFHDSSIADTLPRKWVLQVLYQAAGVRSFAQYLVEHTGLLSWLSSVAVNDIGGGLGLQDEGSGHIAFMALQVIERILSWGNLHRHFLLDCLEELSKAGHVFHQLLVRNPTQQYQNLFQRSTLKILLTLVSLSHKRRKHQTHFTLNLGGLVDVLHSVSITVIPGTKPPVLHMEDKALALQLVLHVPPTPVHTYEDKLAFMKVASWAQSVALDLETHRSNGKSSFSVNSNHFRTRPQGQESLSEKLLRWLAASLVLGELAKEGSHPELRENFFRSSSAIGGLKHTKFTQRDTARIKMNEQLASLLLALEGYVSRKTECTSLVPVVAALIVLTRLTRSSIHPGDMDAEVAQQKIHRILELLLLELPCPEETNFSWQWSFNSPWSARDESVQSTDESLAQARYVVEICRTVLIFLQQILLRQPTDYKSHLSHWESLLSWKPQTANDSDNDSIMEIVGIKLGRLRTKLCTTLQRIPSH